MQTKKEIVREWMIAGVLTLVLLGGAIWVLNESFKLLMNGIKYAEAVRATQECLEWQDLERAMPEWDEASQTGYYVTGWQKSQCDAVGVELTAHVLK